MVQHVVKCLCLSCGKAADIAVPIQALVLAWGGLARTLIGYRVGIELAAPPPKVCSLAELA